MLAKLALPICGVAVAGIGLKAADLHPIVNPPMRQQNLDVAENQAAASLVGQFRTSVSSWLWLRTDLYLHNGVEMRPLSETEKLHGATVEEAADDGHEKLRESGETTVVPPKERDFRGLFGDVEREVASFKDMHEHSHNEPEQALPLFRLMTWLDPQFVQGWTTGAMVIARDRGARSANRAVDFLGEGWKANPNSVEIPSQMGTILASRKRDFVVAAEYLESARAVGRRNFDHLAPHDREALEATYRWLGLCYRESNLYAKEREVLVEGLGYFSDDRILQRLLEKNREVQIEPTELARH